MDRSAAVRVFLEFQLHLAEPRFGLVAIQSADYALAREWIARLVTPLRALDAIHLAATLNNGLTLVTADKDLAASARHFGVRHKFIS
jgi:predicted nucleic acid-binding protein